MNFFSTMLVIEKKRNQDKPGPGKYMEKSHLDYFNNDIRYNNKFTNSRSGSFGGEKRFSFPSKWAFHSQQIIFLSFSNSNNMTPLLWPPRFVCICSF